MNPIDSRFLAAGARLGAHCPGLRRALPILALVPLLAALLPAQSWTQSNATGPSMRYGHGMAYDAARDEVVLFGGYAGPNGQTLLNDTWVFDGTSSTWTQRTPTTSPPARFIPNGMAYDPVRKVVVLFGGWSGSILLDDTWEWNGTNWNERVTSTQPEPRFVHAMAYDGQRLVIFGGRDGTPSAGTLQTTHDDTWAWDETNIRWNELTPTSSPLKRRGHAMAYDSARGRVVLFGGSDNEVGSPEYILFAGTWEWNGASASWSQRSSAKNPSARVGHTISFDSARGRTVVFGGRNPNTPFLGDTWEWSGSNWSERKGKSPAARWFTALAFDSTRDRNVLFGGWGNNIVFADTWENGPKPGGGGGKGKNKFSGGNLATFTPFGTGCPGSGGTPTLGSDQGSLPFIGEAFKARLENLGTSPSLNRLFVILGDSRTLWNQVNLPLDLTFLGMPGCSLYTNPIATFPLTNRGGVATWSVHIPNDPSYVGLSIYTQGAVTSPGANRFGMVVSNACEMRIGAR